MSEEDERFDIAHLHSSHIREGFDCGNPRLNTYLLHLASQHERRGLGRTFVLLRRGDLRVLGFYTLASSAVHFAHVPEGHKLPHYPIPMTKLGQLAVDRTMQGQRWGQKLLLDALARAERIAREVASYAVELDAIDETARTFYERFGFLSLLDDRQHLYCTMKKISQLHLNVL